METMRAWVLTAPNQLELNSVPIPRCLADEVLIKIESMCLCNGSDPGIYHGHEAYDTPMIFGHEASGTIIETGAQVEGFKNGDRVCFWCAMGAFAEFQAVSPKRVAMFPVPKNLTLEETPILELVIAACRALMHLPATENRKSITVCGLGPSGLTLVQYARLLGYTRIVGWDLYEPRRQLALELGADAVYDPAVLDNKALVQMNPTDLSVVMMGDDLLPGEPTVTALMRATAVGGTIVSYGHPEKGRRFSPFVFQGRNLCIVGPVNDLAVIREKFQPVLAAIEAGKMKISPMITHQLPFEELGNAFAGLLEQPEAQIKVVFTF